MLTPKEHLQTTIDHLKGEVNRRRRTVALKRKSLAEEEGELAKMESALHDYETAVRRLSPLECFAHGDYKDSGTKIERVDDDLDDDNSIPF